MTEMKMTLECNAFEYGERIPSFFTCDGANRPPDLRWQHAPRGTRSFVLIVEDPDAPHGTFTHWVRFDIPGDRNMLSWEGPSGIDGRNDFQSPGYGGPCPPPNHGDHRYFFRLYALDIESLGLERGASRAAVEEAMKGHVLAEAELMGRYSRGGPPS